MKLPFLLNPSHMNAEPIKKIIIVGGGTAGWMAAATLGEHFKNSDKEILLIESDEIGTVGVGEATVPGIRGFNARLGLDEAEFIQATQATFKLGIEFKDWFKTGTSFFHPFAEYGIPLGSVEFYQAWLLLQKNGYGQGLEKFCLSTQMALANKFAQPDEKTTTGLARYNYAYHFDASLYAKFLRQYAEKRGVMRVEGKIAQVNCNKENGFIESVQLENQALIRGELFIDCSGFKGLLIEQTLQTGYEDWSHWLPCDSAVAMQTKSSEPPVPYTRSTALEAGWQWKIPLQHRAGNGYVFCSRFISDEQAIEKLCSSVTGDAITKPKIIKFTTGIRKKFWNKNCVALGLASGFLEPLESTSISLIQTGIEKLLLHFPNSDFDPKLRDRANLLNEQEYARIRDFIILHYKANQKTETPFWEEVRQMSVPETLENKIQSFMRDGTLVSYDTESFHDASWLSMYTGFQIFPNQLKDSTQPLDQRKLLQVLEKMRVAIARGVDAAPTHSEFLATL